MLGFALGAAIAVQPLTEPQVSPASSVAASAEPASHATAAALARTVAPPDVMVSLEIDQARKAILSIPQFDPDAKELETEYPGIWQAVWTAIEPEMRRSVEAEYPSFWAALEKIYVSRLTEVEAQALLGFYRSPTGQKLLRTTLENVDATPIFKDIIASPDSSISAEQLKQVGDAARDKGAEKVARENPGELLALARQFDMKKFRMIGEETQKLTLEWVNQKNPEAEGRLQKVMTDAIDRYMAAHPSGKMK